MTEQTTDFRERVRAGEPLVGTFVKTPAYQIPEVLGSCGLDFIVLDEEHAPFGAAELDACILAARGVQLPVLVRVASAAPERLLRVLDMGAAGVVVPHVTNEAAARAVVEATKYSGSRGFTNSSRAAGYGRADLAQYMAEADAATVIVAQIEDPEAVENIEAIAAVDEIDCLFLGRADLAAAYGAAALDDPRIEQAVERVCEAARGAGRAAGIFLPHAADAERFRQLGISVIIAGSDQSLLKKAAGDLKAEFE